MKKDFGTRRVHPKDLCSLRGAAEQIGVFPATVWAWVSAGLLASVEIGNSTVVHIEDVRKVNTEMLTRQQSIAGRTKTRSSVAS